MNTPVLHTDENIEDHLLRLAGPQSGFHLLEKTAGIVLGGFQKSAGFVLCRLQPARTIVRPGDTKRFITAKFNVKHKQFSHKLLLYPDT